MLSVHRLYFDRIGIGISIRQRPPDPAKRIEPEHAEAKGKKIDAHLKILKI
jgi:hypothetical protein